MNSPFPLVKQDLRSQRAILRIGTILALGVVLVPSLARAQDAPGFSLPFKDILFIERDVIGGGQYNGLCHDDQYYGHNGKPGGGLFLLKNFQSDKPEKVDIVAGLTVPSGGLNAGQALSSGTFLSPNLSYDGRTIVFSWSSGGQDKWKPENRFHIFKVDLDGKNLAQLTDGDFDDMHPAWLPSGRIVFVSTRRGGFGRDNGRPVPTFTLHSMKSDGKDIIRLSHHEASEYHPSVTNDGRIVYTRRDYIDRDNSAAHSIWLCNPDGTNPRCWGGNYALPLNTLVGTGWSDGRKNGKRPMAEFYPRAMPGSATKYLAVAGPHHGEAYGTLIMRDFSKVDDNEMGQVTKLTPDVGMPETAENGGGVYGPAWPLSETLFLTSYNSTIVLLDTSVTPPKLTELYKSDGLRPIYATPVAARPLPPVLPTNTDQGERWWPGSPPATVQVYSVYTTDDFGKLPAGVKVASMRIVQILLKTTPNADSPRIGYSSQNVGKMVLGTVPVDPDGSAFFEAPIGKPILFQLLDEKGMAVHSMRSATYLHPGENLTCIGCHEDKLAAPPSDATPSAWKRAPSKLEPELGRVEPANFHRVVEPILTKKCVACHAEKRVPPSTSSYGDQMGFAWWFAGGAAGNREAIHGGSRTTPGRFGAQESRMGKALLSPTHLQAQTNGAYSEIDVRTLTQWLDIGSDEFGAFESTEEQKRGELVWPTLDVDKEDPQGLRYKPESTLTGLGRDGGVSISPRPDADARQSGPSDVPSASPEPDGGSLTTPTGGTTAQGGTGGSDTQSTISSGGQAGSGSQASTVAKLSRGCSCSTVGGHGAPTLAWLLPIVGLAFIVRGRRGSLH